MLRYHRALQGAGADETLLASCVLGQSRRAENPPDPPEMWGFVRQLRELRGEVGDGSLDLGSSLDLTIKF